MKKLILVILFCTSVSYGREVNFSWNPINDATAYEIQIDTTNDFKTLVTTQMVQGTTYKADLFPGKYLYRVRVNDGKNTPGKWTDPTPLSVHGGTPDAMQPADNFVLKYYEIKPAITLTWTTISKAGQYKIIIKDGFGDIVVNTVVTEAVYKVVDLSEGTYQWQVASILDGDNISPLSNVRTFKIERVPLVAPTLKSPVRNVPLALWNNPFTFDWRQDPHTHFTDITIESAEDKSVVEKYINIKDSSFTKDFVKTGKFIWFVTTKEGPDTAGVSSEPAKFSVVNDPLHSGNYELEVSASYANDLYSTTSTLQTNGTQAISQTSQTTASIYGFSAGYYLTRGLGFFISERGGSLLFESFNGYQREQDATLRLRMGANGFSQEFWLGYRQMNFLEMENTPSLQNINISATGPLLGTRLTADINDRWKVLFTAYYFTPIAVQGTNGTVMADIPGGSLGVKWNVADHLWFGYRFGLERVNGNFIAPNQAPSFNSSWTMWQTEPFWFSLSYER